MKKLFLFAVVGTLVSPFSYASPDSLDELYGIANRPSYIKHYEVDKSGNVLLNPYLQVGSKEFPAMLDPRAPVYNYVITIDGKVALIEEAPHPYGRLYKNGFFRPEDKSERKPGTIEKYGHTSAVGGGPGRISGEIINTGKCWMVNNKSGRYSKRNNDRTPQQLFNAFQLIKEVVDPNGMPYCKGATYLLGYAPDYVSKELRNSPKMVYEDPGKKKNAHILLTSQKDVPNFKIPEYHHLRLDAVNASVPDKKAVKREEFPTTKGKAAYNDDPS